MLNLTPLILALPLMGFLLLGLCGRAMSRGVVSAVGCGTVALATVAAVIDFISMIGQPVAARASSLTLFNWVTSGTLSVDFGLLSDPLSAVMLLIVTGVGFLIHVYSIGYMADDEGYWRFFSFLNLFVFAMALLVAADNFLFLLMGWAGVGLASFLLIGFWYTRPAAVAAAKKAFVVNVIGDFGLMLAIFLIFKGFGTLSYPDVFSKVTSGNLVTAIALLLFVGAVAKSAQLPLHVWLPDAMEGPTPVSALIHAATMVTAGVYLVARAAPLFSASPTALAVVGIVGAASALFAATIACVQTDIKRVLAYSTMSQLGYMFLGESSGGFSSGIFHLTTHAYFKALLFMCAGAVIHALAGEQDMRKMGGLRHKLTRTFWLFVVGGLALAAIPPLSGFWSKDAILSATLARGTTGDAGSLLWLVLYVIGLATASLTGFYTFRLIFAVFLWRYRGAMTSPHSTEHGSSESIQAAASLDDPLARVHEVSQAMLGPMLVLGTLSLLGGFYGLPWANWLGDFLAPVTGLPVELATGSALFWLSILLGFAAGTGGILLAWLRYGVRQPDFAPSHMWLVTFLENRWYLDVLYDRVLVRPILATGRTLRRWLEGVTLDGGGRGVGGVVARTSAGLRALQTGYARNYAVAILLGAVLILIYYALRP